MQELSLLLEGDKKISRERRNSPGRVYTFLYSHKPKLSYLEIIIRFRVFNWSRETRVKYFSIVVGRWYIGIFEQEALKCE